MRWVDDDVVEDSSGSAQGHVIPAFDSRVGVSDYLTFLLGHEDNDAWLGKLAFEERSVASRGLRRRGDEALRVEVVMRLDKESAEPANRRDVGRCGASNCRGRSFSHHTGVETVVNGCSTPRDTPARGCRWRALVFLAHRRRVGPAASDDPSVDRDAHVTDHARTLPRLGARHHRSMVACCARTERTPATLPGAPAASSAAISAFVNEAFAATRFCSRYL